MKQTSVEYVIQNVIKKHFGGGWLIDETIKKEIEQANKMFEQQIEDAWKDGFFEKSDTPKEYYHKTFKIE